MSDFQLTQAVVNSAMRAVSGFETRPTVGVPAPTAVSIAPISTGTEKPALTFFESIALPLVTERGWKVCPCFPRAKTVHTKLVPEPLTMMSNDPAKIHEWGIAEPQANACVYAEQVEGGLLFLDKDGGVSLREKYDHETGKKFPQTLLVRSSVVDDGAGRPITKGHWYFYQTPRTLALTGNIPESKTGGLFSLRVHNQYVTSIGSIHPKTGLPYEIAEDFPIAPIPDDLLDWLLQQAVEEKKVASVSATGERKLIPHGQLHPAYTAEAGRLWQRGYSAEDVVDMTVKWIHANGEPPIDDAKVRKEVLDVTKRYPRGQCTDLFLSKPETGTPAPADWLPLIPVEDTLSAVLTFKPAFLPLGIRDWVTNVSKRMSVPLDFAGICALTVLSGVTGRRAFVYPKARDKSWKESIALSGAVVSESGTVKTPTWKVFMNVVTEIDADLREEHGKQMAAYKFAVRTWKESCKGIKKSKASEPDKAAAISALGPDPVKPEARQRVLLNDATPEKMHEIMTTNPRGLLYYRDELHSWVTELDKEGREQQRGIFLAAMNGDDAHEVDRIGRDGGFAMMCVSVFGSFQPELFRDFLSQTRNIDDGLIPRFSMFAWPDEIDSTNFDEIENDLMKERFRRAARRLAMMKEKSINLHFDPEAQILFFDWLIRLTEKIKSETNLGKRSHLNKYRGGLPKIAGLLQLIDLVSTINPNSVRAVNLDTGAATIGPVEPDFSGSHLIDVEHLQMAISLMEYLESHMQRAYGSIRTPVQQIESLLARELQAGKIQDGFSARDINRTLWGGRKKPDTVEMALEGLAEKHWVRHYVAPVGATGGRPCTRYEINPAVTVKR